MCNYDLVVRNVVVSQGYIIIVIVVGIGRFYYINIYGVGVVLGSYYVVLCSNVVFVEGGVIDVIDCVVGEEKLDIQWCKVFI